MWTRIAFLLVALAAASAEFGWKSGQQYDYELTSTTLTGLKTSPQYTGLVVKANLVIRATSEQELIAVIENPQKAQIHSHLKQGKELEIPKELLQYQPLTLTKQPFIIRLKDGVVDHLVISKEVPIWEVNIIRSIVSQLQVDTQGKKIIPSKLNMLPEQENEITGVYKIMEDTVEGECEVLYDISPLPKYILQRTPQLAPLHEMTKEERMTNIIKTKNFTNCVHRPGYHFGITGLTQWKPTANKMGDFFSRSSVSRVVISGSLKSYTIHSSETTNNVVLSPELYNDDKATVMSRVNLTLVSVKPVDKQVEQPTQPQIVKKLVYDYNSPTATDQEAREKWDKKNELTERSGATYKKEKKSRHVRSILKGGSSESSSSESSSVSTETWHQETPRLSHPPETPFFPYHIGCSGHSIQHCHNVNVNQAVKQLSEQIAQLMQNPKHIPQTNTLERFTTLIRIIRTMNAKELEQATQDLWTKKEQQQTVEMNTEPRRSAWMVYRDAVAQAGTGPALVTIKEWIQTDKIREEEAAQVVASLAESAMQPTTEYMNTFYRLVKDQKVVGQNQLNTSAIYTFTKLVRVAQVHKRSIHNRYPVYTFGRLISADDKAVVEEYIPYLAQQLERAIQQEDSPKIQVYIRALGNMAHPKILQVFEPYLEGQKPMTDFQRTLVIVSLNDLARVHPRLARSVLYKTYANVGEVDQVRVAAVFNLMRTVPPANMLQRMAQSTHVDPSIQVRAAIKTAIESAALLKKPYKQLRQNAQAAVNMLTPHVYGIQYSRANITDFVLEGLKIGYTDILQYIGSEDSIIPSSIFYSVNSELENYQRPIFKLGAMVSSVQDLVDLFVNTFSITGETLEEQTMEGQDLTYGKVIKMLNVEHPIIKQLEGNFLYKLAGSERYFTYDNHTIEGLLEKLIQLPYLLATGYGTGYQKLYNRQTIQIGFPTVTGLPFVYNLETPTLLIARGKVQSEPGTQEQPQGTHKGQTKTKMVKMAAGIVVQGVHTSRTQGEIGFVTPFDHQRYIAGHKQEYQIELPVQAKIELNLQENHIKLGLQPYQKSEELKIFHYNSKQYTAVAEITEFKPVLEGSNTKIINVRQPQKLQYNLGEKTGLPIRVQIETEKQYFDLKTLHDQIKRHNTITPLIFPTQGKTVENTKIDIYYDKNYAQSLVLGLGIYGTQKTKETQKTYGKITKEAQEVLGKVQSGIKSPEGVVFDLQMEVKGQRNTKYTTVLGYGHSMVDEQKRVVIRHHKTGGDKPFHLCLDGITKMTIVPETFEKAVKHQPKGQLTGELRFGDSCESGAQVNLVGVFERTPERVEYLKTLPQVYNCFQETKRENKLLSACTNATYNANLMNRYVFNVKYQNLPTTVKNMTYQVYTFLRHIGYPYLTEKIDFQRLGHQQQDQGEHKIEMDVKFSPDLKSVSTHLTTPIGIAHFNNIRLNKYLRTVFVMHPTWSVVRRLGWSALRQQYDAYCTIDQTQVKTFDNLTYPVEIGQQWNTVFVSVPKIDEQGQYVGVHKVVVLAKETQGKNKEVKIISEGTTNKFGVLVHITPASGSVAGKVQVNGQDVQVTPEQVYEYHDKKGVVIVKVFALPTGELKFVFPECDFEFLYDRVRVQVFAGQVYKNRVLGLCGDYNGDRFDYVTPKGKYLRDPREFTATWTLGNEGHNAELKERAEKNSVSKTVILTGVVSDQDAGRTDIRGRQYTAEEQLRADYDSSSSSESTENECMTKRIMLVEREGKHCFSTTPQISCKPGCQVEKTKEMTGKFVCVNKTQTSAHWAQMVNRGAKLNLADKVNNVQELTYQAPVECSKI